MKVRIEPEIMGLVAKYRGKNKAFMFSEHYSTSVNMNKIINQGLKLIGKDIGVPNLNYYYARHSMASLCANKLGIDIARVDEMLNHRDPKLALARVYIERDYKPLWEANRKLLDLFDWSFYTKEAEE
jgi:integrase